MKPDRFLLVVTAVLLVAGLAIAVVSLSWPLGWRHGLLAWVGDVMHNGGFPYRDAFDTKGPAAFLPFVAGQAGFGRQAWAIRAFDLMTLVAIAFPLRSALVRLGHRQAFPLGFGLLITWYYSQGYGDTALPGAWAALLGALVTCLFLGRTRAPGVRTALAAGTAIALAVLLDPVYLAFALIPLAGVILDERQAGRRRAGLVAVGSASTLFVLIAAGVVLRSGGALHGWLREVLETSAYAATGARYPLAESLGTFVRHFRQGWLLLGVPAGLAGFVTLQRGRRLDAAILGFWLGAALLVPIVTGRWVGPNMHSMHAAFAVLAAIGLVGAWASATGPARTVIGVFAVMLALLSSRPVITQVRDWTRWHFSTETEADYARHFEPGRRGYSYRSSKLIAEYVAHNSEPGDRVLAVENPLVNYLSGRAAPGRFMSVRPTWRVEVPLDDTRRREFDAGVAEGRPLWIVLGPPAIEGDSLDDGIPVSDAVTPAFVAEVGARYRIAARCENYFLYRRVDAEGGRKLPPVDMTSRGPSCATLAGSQAVR